MPIPFGMPEKYILCDINETREIIKRKVIILKQEISENEIKKSINQIEQEAITFFYINNEENDKCRNLRKHLSKVINCTFLQMIVIQFIGILETHDVRVEDVFLPCLKEEIYFHTCFKLRIIQVIFFCFCF
jgi:hypothetical protein